MKFKKGWYLIMMSYVVEYKQFDDEIDATEIKFRDFSIERPFTTHSTEVVANNPFEAVEMLVNDYGLSRGQILNVFEKKITKLDRSEYYR